MIALSKYLTATGQIKSIHYASDQKNIGFKPGEAFIEGRFDTHTQYVVNEKIISRPTLGCSIDKTVVIADETDVCVISNVPANIQLLIDNDEISITDGTDISIDFDSPGKYIITLVPEFPTAVWEVSVYACAP